MAPRPPRTYTPQTLTAAQNPETSVSAAHHAECGEDEHECHDNGCHHMDQVRHCQTICMQEAHKGGGGQREQGKGLKKWQWQKLQPVLNIMKTHG
jgi:hypothetical protein